jgi:hypothetical protein
VTNEPPVLPYGLTPKVSRQRAKSHYSRALQSSSQETSTGQIEGVKKKKAPLAVGRRGAAQAA